MDGKAVYTATKDIPSTPGKIMMNVWPGTGVDSWLMPYNGRTGLTAYYDWASYDAPSANSGSNNSGSNSSSASNTSTGSTSQSSAAFNASTLLRPDGTITKSS